MAAGVGVIRRRKDRCEIDLTCVWGFLLLKSEGADFLAQHTLLQAFVASMLVRNSTIKAW